MSKFENLNEPPKSQWSNSIAQITWLGPLLSTLAYIGSLWLARTVLPSEDIESVKLYLTIAFGGTAATSGALGIGGLVKRSLILTEGKIKAQLPAMPETVSAGGDVNVGTQAPADDFIDNDGDGVQDDFEDEITDELPAVKL